MVGPEAVTETKQLKTYFLLGFWPLDFGNRRKANKDKIKSFEFLLTSGGGGMGPMGPSPGYASVPKSW